MGKKKKNRNKRTETAEEGAAGGTAAGPAAAAAAAAAAPLAPAAAAATPAPAAAAATPTPAAVAATPAPAAVAATPAPAAVAATPAPTAAASSPLAADTARPAAPAAPVAPAAQPELAAAVQPAGVYHPGGGVAGPEPNRGRGGQQGHRGRGEAQQGDRGGERGDAQQGHRGGGRGERGRGSPGRGRAGVGRGTYASSSSPMDRAAAPAEGASAASPAAGGDGAAAVASASSAMARLSVADTQRDVEKIFQPAPSQRVAAKTAVIRPPKKKQSGTVGQPIKLIANHFDFNFKIDEVYHYDIEIQPRCPKSVKRRIFQQAMDTHDVYRTYYPAFDGEKNMYTARRLPRLADGTKATLTVSFVEEGSAPRDYTVQVQPAQPCAVDITPVRTYLSRGGTDEMPTSAVQALDIVLRHLPSLRFTPVGKSFFPEQGERLLDIGGGCELWIGYFSSIRHGWKQARINIDVSNKAFHKTQPVVEKMAEIVGRNFDPRRGLNMMQQRDIEKQLRQLKVQYTRPQGGKRSYRVNGLTPNPASQTMFDLNGKQVSVAQYFAREQHKPLQFAALPCLWVGSREKRIYIPPEVCTVIKGQVNRSKLNPDQVSRMIRQTAVKAPERLKRIQEFVRQADFNRDPYNKEFGLQVADRPTMVTGRVLPAPTLLYQQNMTVQPRDGVWDLRQKRFLDARKLERWCVLDYSQSNPAMLGGFLENLAVSARQLGMGMVPPLETVSRNGFIVENTNVERDLADIKRKHNNPQLVLVVLPLKNKLYNAVKHAGDVTVGQLTSCVLQQTMSRNDRQTAGNICQKINAKLGGSNNGLAPATRPAFLREPTIIFGADVTHPPPDQMNKPSIAAVVASLDASYHARYGQRVLVQFPTNGRRAEEMIADLKTAVRELLVEFWRLNNKTKPTRIIFFRDGVSEGQFMQVMSYELEQVREACRSLEKGYQPKITFLVVQKRHHTRLFASDMRQSVGRSQNVPPGTVVDSVISHPTEMDYFLVSHQGIQGTSRPTHYHVLHDDSDFTMDQLELLTYYMCHLFSRCTRSVSNPAPSYYAHLAAYRARAHHDNYLRLNRIPDDAPADHNAAIEACKPNQMPTMYYV